MQSDQKINSTKKPPSLDPKNLTDRILLISAVQMSRFFDWNCITSIHKFLVVPTSIIARFVDFIEMFEMSRTLQLSLYLIYDYKFHMILAPSSVERANKDIFRHETI